MATVFEARWGGGKCGECGDPIEKGDWVSYAGSDLVHEECGYSTYNYNEITDWGENAKD